MSVEDLFAFEPQTTIGIDFETHFDTKSGYTLKKMSTEAYIRDPRFEALLVGVKVGSEPAEWLEIPDFIEQAKQIDWSAVAVECYHAHFDGLILSHHFGIHPGIFFDPLSMAQILHPGLTSKRLEAIAAYYGAGEKGKELANADGKHRADFTREQWEALGRYCMNDVEIMSGVFDKMLANGFPSTELWMIDTTVKMFTKPRFVLDDPRLRAYLGDERKKKFTLMRRIAGLTEDVPEDVVQKHVRPYLMSGDKFAKVLVDAGAIPGKKLSPTVSKKTGKREMIWAFAKDDPSMQALLEDPDEDIRLLAEARVAVKSTGGESRTERLLKAGANGRPVPIYLKHGAAHTHRWGGSDGLNPQNFEKTSKKDPKKGQIRKSLLAPPGFKVVVADSAQVEGRGTAWMAGHTSLLEAFADPKRDAYCEFGSATYGRPITKADEIERFVSKVCLGAETQVLTHQGWKRIIDVLHTDLVWDGLEWVGHLGLVPQGVRETWESNSVAATPDHEILTEHGWREWSAVLTNPSLFRSALSSVVLPSWTGSVIPSGQASLPGGIRSCGARVAGKGSSYATTSSEAALLDAIPAPKLLRVRNGIGSTSTRWGMTSTERGCSTGSQRAFPDAPIPAMPISSTTGDGESESAPNGPPTAPRSFVSCRPFPDGMTLPWNLIALTATGATPPATSGSSRRRATSETSGTLERCSSESRILRRRIPTYDLLCAGTRHRFTVWSSSGPLIVHNCVLGLGYNMGWSKFAATMLKGAMGGPPVQFGEAEVDQLGINVLKFAESKDKLAKVRKIPTRLSLEHMVIHCAVAEKVVYQYRDRSQPIVDLWKLMEEVIEAMIEGDKCSFGPGDVFRTTRHGIIKPSGLVLQYPGLKRRGEKAKDAEGEEVEDPGGVGDLEETGEIWGSGYSYIGGKGGKQRVRCYGGLLTENVCQSFCRDIVGEQMLRLKAKYGYEPALMSHDEIVLIVPEAEAELAKARCLEEMRISPWWCPGIPLNAEAGIGQSYGEAK